MSAAAISSSIEETSASAPPVLLISEATVESSLSMAQAVHINAQAFLAALEATAVLPTYNRIVEPVPYDAKETRATLFKPAQLGDALGVKVVAIRATNARLGLSTVPAMMLLQDRDTGFPVALVQATFLTAFRTAAGCAAATDAGARRDASVLSVFGAGLQAREHIKAMLCVRPIIKVHIINRSAPRATELAQLLAPLYPAVSFEVHASADAASAAGITAAVRSSHIICTTTNSSVPLVTLSMVSPGTHINAIGSYLPHMHELSSELVAACRIAIDLETATHAGDLHTPIAEGRLRPDQLVHIGAYLPREKYAGKIDGIGSDLPPAPAAACDKPKPEPWRRSDDEVTLFKSVGSAVQDVATAHAVLQVCQAKGQGKVALW